jgi:serine acetyltransferase
VIGDEVTIHPHTAISPGITIGDRATIGAGSIVLADVANDATVFGSPARPVAT